MHIKQKKKQHKKEEIKCINRKRQYKKDKFDITTENKKYIIQATYNFLIIHTEY